MTSEERAEIVLTARMLRAATNIHWLTTGLTLVAAAALIFGSGNRIAAVVAILFGLAANFYTFRTALDARLFEDIIVGTLSTSDLDSALEAIGKRGNEARPWPDRCRGARQLALIAAAITAAQVIATIAIALS